MSETKICGNCECLRLYYKERQRSLSVVETGPIHLSISKRARLLEDGSFAAFDVCATFCYDCTLKRMGCKVGDELLSYRWGTALGSMAFTYAAATLGLSSSLMRDYLGRIRVDMGTLFLDGMPLNGSACYGKTPFVRDIAVLCALMTRYFLYATNKQSNRNVWTYHTSFAPYTHTLVRNGFFGCVGVDFDDPAIPPYLAVEFGNALQHKELCSLGIILKSLGDVPSGVAKTHKEALYQIGEDLIAGKTSKKATDLTQYISNIVDRDESQIIQDLISYTVRGTNALTYFRFLRVAKYVERFFKVPVYSMLSYYKHTHEVKDDHVTVRLHFKDRIVASKNVNLNGTTIQAQYFSLIWGYYTIAKENAEALVMCGLFKGGLLREHFAEVFQFSHPLRGSERLKELAAVKICQRWNLKELPWKGRQKYAEILSKERDGEHIGAVVSHYWSRIFGARYVPGEQVLSLSVESKVTICVYNSPVQMHALPRVEAKLEPEQNRRIQYPASYERSLVKGLERPTEAAEVIALLERDCHGDLTADEIQLAYGKFDNFIYRGMLCQVEGLRRLVIWSYQKRLDRKDYMLICAAFYLDSNDVVDKLHELSLKYDSLSYLSAPGSWLDSMHYSRHRINIERKKHPVGPVGKIDAQQREQQRRQKDPFIVAFKDGLGKKL